MPEYHEQTDIQIDRRTELYQYRVCYGVVYSLRTCNNKKSIKRYRRRLVVSVVVRNSSDNTGMARLIVYAIYIKVVCIGRHVILTILYVWVEICKSITQSLLRRDRWLLRYSVGPHS